LHARTHGSGIFPSPFNIKKQAILFVPKATDMPEPETKREDKKLLFRDALGEHIYQLIYANKGNAFVLFSSNDELLSVRQYLTTKVFPYPIISQSEFSPEDAMTKYRTTDNATLLGSKSFWEGVDVAGEKLSLVVICKLPFPNPYDPIVMARQKLVKETGRDAFPFVDLPDMLLDLRQGVGRLIRTITDRGVIAILDSRIYSKPYGKVVTDAIGTNPHNNLEKVCNWMAARAG
jgi:ATP-dependent DNA helicase DinG